MIVLQSVFVLQKPPAPLQILAPNQIGSSTNQLLKFLMLSFDKLPLPFGVSMGLIISNIIPEHTLWRYIISSANSLSTKLILFENEFNFQMSKYYTISTLCFKTLGNGAFGS